MRELILNTSVVSVMILALGCNGASEVGEAHRLRIVDADTRKPILECVGISLVAKTPWHRWSDPDESEFKDWHVVKVQLLQGDNAQLWQAEYNVGYGSIFFLVRQERRGNVIFARGYEPDFYEYLGLQFYGGKSDAGASSVSKPVTSEDVSIPDFPMLPLDKKDGRAKPGARALQRRQEKLAFLLGQDAMWNDLVDHHRAGKDREAIKLACDCVMLTLDSLTMEDKAAATREHPRIIEWCLQVSHGVR